MRSGFSLSGIDRSKVKTPAQLYRVLRPEYFSDSIIENEKMPREMFKHIMSQLSTDMRQDAFEEFTRRCVQRLITPNIIPQTGPTGGGDAKADLITFPVSKATSSVWTVPGGGSSGNEKWAFAISSVQKWSPKMDRDVKKIVDYLPDTTRIFFCTNQAVASRSRLNKQKKYQKEYHIETEILDLNWYVQAVYDQGCYDDAVDSLGLGESLKQVKKLGPKDTEREARLAELDKVLPKTQVGGYDDHYVDGLVEAARLSRELERPQQEVYGRYAVAKDAAKIPVLLEFRREHRYSERCRDVNAALDLMVHDLSLCLSMFRYEDLKVSKFLLNKNGDRAQMQINVVNGDFAGATLNFVVDRNSENDVRTISVKFTRFAGCPASDYSVSLARYDENGEVVHVPDSLENEHKFFLKLMVHACAEWGRRAAQAAADAVKLATSATI